MTGSKEERPKHDPETPSAAEAEVPLPETPAAPWPRVVFWVLLIVTLGLSWMVLEDFLSHTFNR